MSFLDDLSSGLADVGNSISQKTKDISESTKIGIELSRNRDRRAEEILKLGEAVYADHQKGVTGDYSEILAELDRIEEVISKLQDNRAVIKGSIICDKCGAEVPQGTAFCSACGNKIRTPEFVKCPACGVELPGETKFCVKCGAKIQ